MKWNLIFEPKKILTDADRRDLEALDASTADLQKLLEKMGGDLCGGQTRLDRVEGTAAKLAEDPTNEELYRQLLFLSGQPSHPHFATHHVEYARRPIEARIGRLMEPQHGIVRRVFTRALVAAETELKRVESRERKEAEAEGFDYSPSGKVQALQQRVLNLRNEVAAPIPGEPNFQWNRGWRERLAEFL